MFLNINIFEFTTSLSFLQKRTLENLSMSGRKSSKSAGGVEEDDKKEGEPLSTEQGETMLQNHILQKQGTLFFYKRPVYKRHEPEICRNFKNKIRKCPG